MTDVDPFGGGHAGPAGRQVQRATDPNAPASAKQRQFLQKIHFWRNGLTAGQAQSLIDDFHRRKSKGLCTPQQGEILAEKGLDPESPREWTTVLFDLLKARGWDAPPCPLTRDRFYIKNVDAGMGEVGFKLHVKDGRRLIPVGKPFASAECVRAYYGKYLAPAPAA